MRIALFHPLLPINPWFYDLAKALQSDIVSFKEIDILESTPINVIMWYADVPFDDGVYARLITKCSTVIWFVPLTTAYKFRAGAPPKEPIRPLVENRDIEEAKVYFLAKYPHLFT